MKPNVVVIGASAGGFNALKHLFTNLPGNIEASFFVVLHLSPDSPSHLATLLNNVSPLTIKNPEDGEKIQKRFVYVAPPDYHLLVKEGYIRLYHGPHENRHRPAVDPLFRSAAVAYDRQVLGIILSGLLDDGSSGLLAVKHCGGITMVQDPEDARYADMPRHAIAAVKEVDYQLPLSQMADAIAQILQKPNTKTGTVPDDIKTEAAIAERVMSDVSGTETLGSLIPMGCPECGGPLWQINIDAVRRYRCHVGHGFTAQTLLNSQDEALEKALWAAMRMMEERSRLAFTMAEDESQKGRDKSAAIYYERAKESKAHAQVLKKLLADAS
ncbi:MAG: chemotaxis protein CheB [Jaaginema sp. PMC 1079.18]|nr:chemotaxis protein CheB [Jaaginema sp. PMC 1080.18]MEC4852838.1 chemotaxis protein CheB [Jaaginema sp. PMC 1079.18]MEC4864718.1 chemotaxis protein CheB [Jaaginema sp. PMC 1078.18]